jgi:group II intron reverse transcriptase/maturase
VRHVEIPKKSGGVRPLGIPTVKDRVVQMAATLVLTPIFEADFRECSFGYRPKRSAQGALERIRETANHGKSVVVDADIRSFFTQIDHELVLKLVQKRVSDRRIHKLIRQWLKSGVMEDGMYRETKEGAPQGGVISPLLSNVVLNELDRMWEDHQGSLGVLTRYGDDFLIQCRSLEQAEIILKKVKAILRGLKLELHPEKTKVVDLDEGKEGFEFLGHCMRNKRSRRWFGKYYLNRWPTPASMNAVREKVRNIACRARFGVKSVKELVPEINRVLVGWGNYYRGGNASESFQKMDSYVRHRLSVFDNKRRSRQQTHLLKSNQRGFYKAMGLYSLSGTVRYLKPSREE